MEKDAIKKAGAVGSAIVVVLAFLSIPVMYYAVEAPVWLVAATFVLLIVVAGLTLYYTMERVKEIEEGLEDDLDDY